MIDISSELLNSYIASPQFNNMWEFYIQDWKETDYNISSLKVISTTLPFMQLESESHGTGHKYYTGYKMPENFSVTFREDSDFSVTNYFKEWERLIFDVYTGCFISSDAEKTRNGCFRYSKFELDATKKELFELAVTDRLSSIGKQAIETVQNKIVDVANSQVGAFIGVGRQTLEYGSKALRKEIGFDSQSGVSKLFKETDTKLYYFKGLRYLGISNQEGSYDSGEELNVVVNFAVDTVLDDNDLIEINSQSYSFRGTQRRN